jgi:hypothetical protein
MSDGRRLHRNNAAEWAMVIALTPLAWAVRAVGALRRRPGTEPSVAPAGSPAATEPPALAYAEAPPGPSIERQPKEVRVDLGRCSPVEVVTAFVSAAAVPAYAAVAVVLPAVRPTGAFEWIMLPIWLVGSVVWLVSLSRTRGEPTVIVADADWVTARGPRAYADQYATARAVRFAVRRRGLPWMSQLDVRGPGGAVSGGDWTTLAVAADRATLLAAADALNAWVGPAPAVPADLRRVRRRRRAALAAVGFASIAAAAGLACFGFALPYEMKGRADLLFGAAIVVAVAPMAAFFIWAEERGSRGPLDRNGEPLAAVPVLCDKETSAYLETP